MLAYKFVTMFNICSVTCTLRALIAIDNTNAVCENVVIIHGTSNALKRNDQGGKIHALFVSKNV